MDQSHLFRHASIHPTLRLLIPTRDDEQLSIFMSKDGPSQPLARTCKHPDHACMRVLKRWAEMGHAGLDDQPSTPRHPARKVTMGAINEVGKLAKESPELGAYRVRAALEQIGIHLSQATCGRLLALNRSLYGLSPPTSGTPRERREMPFKASFRHEF